MSTYLLLTTSKDELYHHGIKGQKWGVRRFQNKDGTRTKAGKDRAKYIRDRAKASRGGIVDDTWKTGSAMLVGTIDSDLQEVSFRTRNGQRFATNPAKTMKDFMNDLGHPPVDFLIDDQHGLEKPNFGFKSFDDVDLGYINPDWGEPGTTQNCAKCTVATELMKYGVGLTAGRQTFPSSAEAMSYWFDGAERHKGKLEDIDATLKNFGDGASGSIAGYYPNGAGGHCMHFSVSNGQVHVQDGQNGRRFNSIKEAADTYGFDLSRDFSSYRLDKATPNWDHLYEDSVIGAPKWQEKGWKWKSNTDIARSGNTNTFTRYDLTQDTGRKYAEGWYGKSI